MKLSWILLLLLFFEAGSVHGIIIVIMCRERDTAKVNGIQKKIKTNNILSQIVMTRAGLRHEVTGRHASMLP